LSPGVLQITSVDWVEAEIVDERSTTALAFGESPASGRAIRPFVLLGRPFSRRLSA
jgi:hypothetical protein